jgi:hypothetical protein
MDHVVYHTEHLHRVSEEEVKENTTNTISQSISLTSWDRDKATKKNGTGGVRMCKEIRVEGTTTGPLFLSSGYMYSY